MFGHYVEKYLDLLVAFRKPHLKNPHEWPTELLLPEDEYKYLQTHFIDGTSYFVMLTLEFRHITQNRDFQIHAGWVDSATFSKT